MASFQNSCVQCFGPNPPCERGQYFQISASPDGDKVVYGAGNTVVIRDVLNPAQCEVYCEHKNAVTCAKFSPNGNYIASGDASGKVRVWAYDHPEHLLKKELVCVAGAVTDISWDAEGKRIVVGGNAKSNNAKVFIWDTGSSQGELTGATKGVLSVDIRPTKPATLVIASQDFKSRFYKGPPFKFFSSNSEHKNFVQCVRFSPDGTKYASVSSDSNIFLFDADSGSKIGMLPKEHKGSIYNCSWHEDSVHLATCSGDKTVKVWDTDLMKCEQTFKIANKPTVDDMQVGIVYCGDNLISVSLSGSINYLNASSPSKPQQIIQAHTSAPTILRQDLLNAKGLLYAGTQRGQVVAYDADGQGVNVPGKQHEAQVIGLSITHGLIYTVGWDDYLRVIDVKKGSYKNSKLALGSQPLGISSSTKHPELVAVVTRSALLLINSMKVVDRIILENDYQPLSVSISQGGTEVVVGGSDKAAHVYQIAKNKLVDNKQAWGNLQGGACAVAHSPDGKYVAVGDKVKEITLWDRQTGEVVVRNKWVFHTSGITDLAFSPTGSHLASTSIDSAVIVWNVEEPLSKTKLKLAHSNGSTSVTWGAEETMYSTGGDICIRQWTMPMP